MLKFKDSKSYVLAHDPGATCSLHKGSNHFRLYMVSFGDGKHASGGNAASAWDEAARSMRHATRTLNAAGVPTSPYGHGRTTLAADMLERAIQEAGNASRHNSMYDGLYVGLLRLRHEQKEVL